MAPPFPLIVDFGSLRFNSNAINYRGNRAFAQSVPTLSQSHSRHFQPRQRLFAISHQPISAATRRAYGADIRQFRRGATTSLAGADCGYLADLAATHTAATINRRLASLAKLPRWSRRSRKAEIVKATVRGIGV